MASRRKSSTPCMVPPPDVTGEAESEDAGVSGSDIYSHTSEGGYECKYCSFRTPQLNLFTVHVDSEHPDVVTNTSYVCVECDFHTRSYDALVAHNARHHPGEGNFTRTMARRNNETVFQQTVNDLTFDGGFVKMEDGEEEEDVRRQGIALSKTPIMRSRAEPKKFTASHKMAVEDAIKVESQDEYDEPPTLSPAPVTAGGPRLVPVSSPLHIQTLSPSFVVNNANVLHVKGGGGGGGGGTILPAGTLAQVLSALQNHQNQTQLLIPVSSIPAYNAAMDNNVLLVSAYSRFPYPSMSEVAALSSQTKFSEENVRVWFSAQRLKHGVSWTPEEVDEARRKKANGTVQTVPQTITVIPANMAAAAAGGLQSIFQTCQIVGQPGLVLTQVGGVAGTVGSPVALTVAPGNRPKASEPSASESKTEKAASLDSASKPKKSKEQLAELKASYGRRQFASEAEISRLMQITRLSKRAIKKWFSDTRYNQRNAKEQHADAKEQHADADARVAAPDGGGRSGASDSAAGDEVGAIVIDSSDDASDAPPLTAPSLGSPRPPRDRRTSLRHAFPDFTPQKFKEKTSEQLLVLESSFRHCDTPSDEELMRLRAQTKLTRREVDAWFIERRKTRDAPPSPHGPDGGDVAEPAARDRHTTAGRKVLKKTPQQLDMLKKAFVRSQWPTAQDYDKMAEDSGLPRSYVVNWFGDTRYACKNTNLKWFYLYRSGKVEEGVNNGNKVHKKSRKRHRNWSTRTRRPYPCKSSPQGGAAPSKAMSGKALLKEHYLQHGVVREEEVQALAVQADMSEQEVRAWLSGRAQEDKEMLSEEEALEGEVKEEASDDTEDQVSPGARSQPT